ncbi:MAG: amidase [Thalassobaculales bacterium]
MTLPWPDASALAAAIASRATGCVEALQCCLERVDRFNPVLNAIVIDDRERALARAAAADAALARGEVWGPLHGVPMTVKESYRVAGLPTSWGNPALKDNVAAEDAVLVERLKAAGAVIFGKTNVPLNLGDFQSYNAIHGTTSNPWNPALVPGGSSGGGAAALAAGMSLLEAGSDIGGSLRNPAHYCGIYAHKPSHGLVPPRGHSPLGSLAGPDLAVIGPMARSARDLDLALSLLAGPDLLEGAGYRLDLPPPRRAGPAALRVAVWLDQALAPVDADVRAGLDRVAGALGRAGAVVDWQARPALDAEAAHRTYMSLLLAVTTSRTPRSEFEAAKAMLATLDPFDTSEAAMEARGAALHHRDWLELNEQRQQARWAWHRFFQDWDVVLAPVACTPAFPHDHRPTSQRSMVVDGAAVPYWTQLFWAGLATMPYLPATAFPAGLTAAGLPVGVQAIGPFLGDRTTIAVAAMAETLLGGFTPPPGY